MMLGTRSTTGSTTGSSSFSGSPTTGLRAITTNNNNHNHHNHTNHPNNTMMILHNNGQSSSSNNEEETGLSLMMNNTHHPNNNNNSSHNNHNDDVDNDGDLKSIDDNDGELVLLSDKSQEKNHQHQGGLVVLPEEEEETNQRYYAKQPTTLQHNTTTIIQDDKHSYLQLRVKSFQDVDITVPMNSTVAQLKDTVRQALGSQARERYLRLICKGRLLHPEESLLSEFKVHNDDVLHAVLAAPGVRPPSERVMNHTTNHSIKDSHPNHHHHRRRGGTIIGPGGRVTRTPITSSSNPTTNRNGGIGTEYSSSSDDEDDDEDDMEQQYPHGRRAHMGFDRLRASGLRRQEITAIRTYFNRHVDRHIQLHSQEHLDELDLRRRRLLFEEDWMSLQGPTSEFRLNLSNNTLLRFASLEVNHGASGNHHHHPLRSSSLGTDRDFMWGFLLGFFVGFVMLVWVWMPSVPHKQKIGILTGISFQLAMNVLRQDNDDEFAGGD